MLERKEEEKKPKHQARKYNICRSSFPLFKIKIPQTLPAAIAHSNKLKSSLDTWLVLKSYCESGIVKLGAIERKDLSNICICSVKTFTKRLKHLAGLGLIEYSKQSALLCSWDKLAAIFELKEEAGHKLHHYFIKYDGSKRIFDVLEAKMMQAKEAQCRKAAISKLTRNSIIAQEVKQLAGHVNMEAVLHSQLHHYLNEFKQLSEDEYFVLFKVARADTALSSKQWAWLFDVRGRGTMAYKKRKLVAAGLITVTKRAYVLPSGTHTTKASRKCILGTAPRIKDKTVFTMPDAITYLSASPLN